MTRHSAAVGRGVVVGDRGADERHAGVGGDGVGDGLERGRVGARWHLGGQAERTVEAGTEAFGQQVVGLAGGGVLGVVAFVGEPEPQAEDRQRQRDEGGGADQHRRPRAVLDDPAPPVRQRLAQRLVLPLEHRLAQRGDGEAGEQHDHRDRERDHDQGGDPEPDADQGDGDQPGGDQPAPAGELDPFTGEPQQGRQQGERGEQRQRDHDGHRRSPCPETKLSCMISMPSSEITTVVPANTTARPAVFIAISVECLDAVTLVQVLPEPGDDEQGVVDADPEADHDPDRRREVGHVHDLRQQPGEDRTRRRSRPAPRRSAAPSPAPNRRR